MVRMKLEISKESNIIGKYNFLVVMHDRASHLIDYMESKEQPRLDLVLII